MTRTTQTKKERFNATVTEHEIPIKLESIQFFPDGTFKMFAEGKEDIPKNISSQTCYMKENGKHKVINQAKQVDNKIITNELQILNNFDAIFAVDTNTKVIKGENLSVSSRWGARILKSDAQIAVSQPFSWKTVYIKNHEQKNAEKIGIAILINHILEQHFDTELKIAIIIDHDLININKYNNREIPVIENVYVPENMTLLYASSDVGKECFLNKLFSLCDKEAKKCLKEAKLGKGIPEFI